MKNDSGDTKERPAGAGSGGLGWSAGGPTGGSDAGKGVEEGREGGENVATDRGATRAMADMDTSGLVESQTTRPSTITPSERPESSHNTERANAENQRDALSSKLNEESVPE